MKKIILVIILSSIVTIVGSATAETIYECSGVVQNRPCGDKQKGKILQDLPPISRYSSSGAIPKPGEEVKARPAPEVFDVPEAEVVVREKKIAPQDDTEISKSAVRGRTSGELARNAAELRARLANKSISIPQAETESIRLRVLHDTLCSKQSATYSNAIEADCMNARSSIQAITAAVRDSRVSLQ